SALSRCGPGNPDQPCHDQSIHSGRMQQKFTRGADRRLTWHPHWEQGICRRCGAWLEELPRHAIKAPPKRWQFIWVCPLCAFEVSTFSGEPLNVFRPDPTADIAPPGELPAWRGWRLPSRLVQNLTVLAERYAQPVEPEALRDVPS